MINIKGHTIETTTHTYSLDGHDYKCGPEDRFESRDIDRSEMEGWIWMLLESLKLGTGSLLPAGTQYHDYKTFGFVVGGGGLSYGVTGASIENIIKSLTSLAENLKPWKWYLMEVNILTHAESLTSQIHHREVYVTLYRAKLLTTS